MRPSWYAGQGEWDGALSACATCHAMASCRMPPRKCMGGEQLLSTMRGGALSLMSARLSAIADNCRLACKLLSCGRWNVRLVRLHTAPIIAAMQPRHVAHFLGAVLGRCNIQKHALPAQPADWQGSTRYGPGLAVWPMCFSTSRRQGEGPHTLRTARSQAQRLNQTT